MKTSILNFLRSSEENLPAWYPLHQLFCNQTLRMVLSDPCEPERDGA